MEGAKVVALDMGEMTYTNDSVEYMNLNVSDVAQAKEVFGKIHCPTLVVVGEDDLFKPVVFSRIIASHIKNSEIYIIPDCGHVTVFEKEDELKTLITGFYAKQRS